MTASDSGKAFLRRQLKSRRDGLDEEYCRRSDAEIRNRLQALPAFRQAGCVFCYVSTGKEPDTRALLEQMLKEGKTVSVPRCREAGIMEAVRIGGMEQLRPGRFGIWEPGEGLSAIEPESIELAVIPCLSGWTDGTRLGYGGGYYDRFLPRCGGLRVMLCRERMLWEAIPREPHDCRMDVLVTEQRLIFC